MKYVYIPFLLLLSSCQDQSDLKKEAFYFENNYVTYSDSRGQLLELYCDFKELAEDKSAPDLQTIAEFQLAVVDSMIAGLDSVIQEIEEIKLDLWEDAGLYLELDKDKDRLDINHFELERVKENRKQFFLSEGQAENSALAKKIKGLRFRLIDFLNYDYRRQSHIRNFSFPDPHINSFTNIKKVNVELDSAIINLAPDDMEGVKRFYLSYSYKNLFIDEDLKGFLNNKTLSEKINCLTLVQNQMVRSSVGLLRVMRARIGCGGAYQFDKIFVNVGGPDIVEEGDSVTLKIFYSFYNSFGKPKVDVQNVNSVQYLKDGITYVRFKAEKDQEVEGKITVWNKSGVPKINSWQKKIKVLPK